MSDVTLDSFAARFWSHVHKTETCWTWTGTQNSNGYGVIWFGSRGKGGKQYKAHRIAYLLHNKQLRDDEVVMHVCDNPICVNPAHLRKGTQQDNLADMRAKKRNKFAVSRGTQNIRSKLNDELIHSIREEYLNGNISQTQLGEKYGVSQSTISVIVLRKAWKHIQDE